MGRNGETWTLRNITSKFHCYPRCFNMAKRKAKELNKPIIIDHHGPRSEPLTDPTKVSHVVEINGERTFARDGNLYRDV